MRMALPDPAVYVANVDPDDIYFTDNGRSEREIVCEVRSCRNLHLPDDEIRTLAAQYAESIKRNNNAVFESIEL